MSSSSSSSAAAATTNSGTSFDPTSSSNITASVLAIVALFWLCMAAFNLGKERNNRRGSMYQLSWWSVPSAICTFFMALCIFFFYD